MLVFRGKDTTKNPYLQIFGREKIEKTKTTYINCEDGPFSSHILTINLSNVIG